MDKDGTIVRDIPYNVNPDLITLNEGVLDGLELLDSLGYRFIIISNQAGIARGYFEEQDLVGVERRIRQLLNQRGLVLSGFYYCPHSEDGIVPEYSIKCTCRKPGPQLILNAAQDHGIDLLQSWMIGDILDDVEAGKSAGCKSILINNGNEDQWQVNGNLNRIPNWISDDFWDAASFISNQHKTKGNGQRAFEYS